MHLIHGRLFRLANLKVTVFKVKSFAVQDQIGNDGHTGPDGDPAVQEHLCQLGRHALTAQADEPGRVQIHPEDARLAGIVQDELVWVASRRGKVISRAEISDRVNQGAVYMTYQWWIGACNELTIDSLDPVAKTPEFKHCAVRLEKIEDAAWAEHYVRESYRQMKQRLAKAAKPLS